MLQTDIKIGLFYGFILYLDNKYKGLTFKNEDHSNFMFLK